MNDYVFYLIVACLLFAGGQEAWHRSRIRAILSQHLGDPPTLGDIQNLLIEINAISPTFTFSADRHTRIHFRGRDILIVVGHVGSVGIGKTGPTWRGSKTLFAIAKPELIPWMTANADVFTPAYAGPNASIYWTRIAKL